ncbi:MAG TPA: DUF2721 domain-containing protein [Myxococcaceae bacterium]|nr:DUF2721 domain-containing protein [Myxococcaceae bacterium]
MPDVNWPQFFSAAVGPVVIVSASAILCSALFNRLSTIMTRLRGFLRERLDEQNRFAQLWRERPDDAFALERMRGLLSVLELQTDRVRRRAYLMRQALVCLLCEIAVLLSCSLMTGVSTVVPEALYVAGPLFVAGLCLALAAIVFALLELRIALHPIELEMRFVDEWVEPKAVPITPPASRSP